MLVNSLDYLVNNLILIQVIDSLGLTVNKLAMHLVNYIHMVTLLDCSVSQVNQCVMATSRVIGQKHLMHRKVKSWDHLVSFHSLGEKSIIQINKLL